MTYVILTCNFCLCEFNRTLKDHNKSKLVSKRYFCSKQCCGKARTIKKMVCCHKCNISFIKSSTEIKRSKLNFCSRSCAATYYNLNKTTGARRSKLEVWIESCLTKQYNLKFEFNQTNAINSELDIYIPELKLAFELNGIFHYEPIFGNRKLNQIVNNDQRKFQACFERGIELCIIDTSQQKYFKESSSKKYLEIIKTIINKRLQQI